VKEQLAEACGTFPSIKYLSGVYNESEYTLAYTGLAIHFVEGFQKV